MTVKDFKSTQTGLASPAESWPLATPNDSVDIMPTPRAILVNGSPGNVVMQDKDGNTMTLVISDALVGVERPFRPVRILATGTTATDIHLLY